MSVFVLLAANALLYSWPNFAYYAAHGTRFFPATSFDEDYHAALAVSAAVGRVLTVNPVSEQQVPAPAGDGDINLVFSENGYSLAKLARKSR